METWTVVRFLLYPLILVFGAVFAGLMFRRYRSGGCIGDAWAGWLGVAVASTGLCGLVALWLSRVLGGFGTLTSALFTLGTVSLAVVLVSAVASIGMTAWRD